MSAHSIQFSRVQVRTDLLASVELVAKATQQPVESLIDSILESFIAECGEKVEAAKPRLQLISSKS